MVIQHNMSAMNADRQLGLVTGSLAKSAEKLSGGYKINRAADDAAGLSISEKMRKQIRGLNQASENIEDGISLCQVADGALNETVDILQRMRELAIKAANGTNSISDRESIEMEITQLKSEIDRIAETTKFNDAVYPLNAPVTYGSIVTETIADNTPPSYDGLLREKTITFKTNRPCTYEGKGYNKGDPITITGLTTNDVEVWVFQGATSNLINPTDNWFDSNGHDDDNMGPLKISDLQTDENGYLYYLNASNTRRYAVYDTDPNNYGSSDPLAFMDLSHALSSYVNVGKGRLMTVADLSSQNQVTTPVTQTSTEYYYFSSNDNINSILLPGQQDTDPNSQRDL